MRELPEGWLAVKLTEVCELNPAKPKPNQLASDLPVTFVPMAAVDAESGTIANPTIREYSAVAKGFTSFQENDVIMAKITPCMENGKAAIARGLSNRIGFGSTEFHVFRPSGAVLPEYVFRFIRQESFRKSAEANMTGSVGQKRVPASFLNECDIPLPPLAEQRRIVAKLETLLGKVDACRQRLAKIPLLLKRFRQAVLAAACSGRLTANWREQNSYAEPASLVVRRLVEKHEAAGGHKQGNAALPTEGAHDLEKTDFPESWELTEMRNLCEPSRPITYGILKPGPETPDGVPYVRVADFPNDRLNLVGIKRTTKEIDSAYARARLRAGDILLSIRGTVGRICIIPAELSGANITQDSARLSIQDAMDLRFVVWFLRAMPTQHRMQKAVKGVAIRGINIGDVRALQVLVPPFAEQQEIVRRVEAFFKLADQLEARYQKAKAQVDRLQQSILAKAFRGELVPTEAELAQRKGREYESAAALLARVREGKRAAETPLKSSRRLKPRRSN